MKNLENRINYENPNVRKFYLLIFKLSFEERRKHYGSLLPKQGVYFLPDTQVLDFLR